MTIDAWVLPTVQMITSLIGDAEWVLVSALFLLTAALMAVGAPGVVIPLSVASGTMLDPPLAATAVALGGAVGSHLLLTGSRRVLSSRARDRVESLVPKIQQNFERYGLWYVIVLRIAGAPHLAITAICAALPITRRRFAIATAIGLLPVSLVAATLGSTI